ncbi:MAG: ABC transporter substrate-binding protein [Desulfobacterales bacterium]
MLANPILKPFTYKIIPAMAYSNIVAIVLAAISIIMIFSLNACTKDGENSRLYTIGLVTNNRNGLRNIQGFQNKMAELGYRVGENVNYMLEGQPVRGSDLDAVLNKMVKTKVDLIFTAGTPTGVAAHRITAGTTVPVVFGVIADPIAAGVIDDLTGPGGNMTGVKLAANQARRLQFLLEMAPGIRRILIPYNPEDAASSSAVAQVKKVAPAHGVAIIEKMAHNDQEVFELLGHLPEHLDAIFLVPGTTVNIHLQKVLAIARARRLPVSGPSLIQVEEGALTAYGFNHYAAGMQAARIADQVLRGTDPGDLPVETAESFLSINLKAAEEINLQIPYSILQQAKIILRSDN